MEFSRIWEGIQSGPVLSAMNSGFAEEDLPSNLIAYYLESQNDTSTPIFPEGGEYYVHPSLQALCDVMSREDSNIVYDLYVQNGGFVTGWNQWERRPNPVPSPSYIDHYCGQCQSWPLDLTIFAALAIPKVADIEVDKLLNTLPSDGWYRLLDYSLPIGQVGIQPLTWVDTSEEINRLTIQRYGFPLLVHTSVEGLYRMNSGC